MLLVECRVGHSAKQHWVHVAPRAQRKLHESINTMNRMYVSVGQERGLLRVGFMPRQLRRFCLLGKERQSCVGKSCFLHLH
jgi:hypothetical protein